MGSARTRATASNRPAAGYGTTIVIGPGRSREGVRVTTSIGCGEVQSAVPVQVANGD